MSSEQQISGKIRELDTTAQVVAAFGNINSSVLSSYLRGAAPMPNDIFVRLNSICDDLLEIRLRVAPVPVNFKNALTLKPALDALREERRLPAVALRYSDLILANKLIAGAAITEVSESYGISLDDAALRTQVCMNRFDAANRALLISAFRKDAVAVNQ